MKSWTLLLGGLFLAPAWAAPKGELGPDRDSIREIKLPAAASAVEAEREQSPSNRQELSLEASSWGEQPIANGSLEVLRFAHLPYLPSLHYTRALTLAERGSWSLHALGGLGLDFLQRRDGLSLATAARSDHQELYLSRLRLGLQLEGPWYRRIRPSLGVSGAPLLGLTSPSVAAEGRQVFGVLFQASVGGIWSLDAKKQQGLRLALGYDRGSLDHQSLAGWGLQLGFITPL